MTAVLRAAAVYNLAWGALVVLAPTAIFRLVGVDTAGFDDPGNYTIPIWQCVGMIVGVYGVGYWFAASDPARHWPIVLVGFLGKIFGPIGYIDAALLKGVFPVEMGWTLLTNDLIWWVPFALILVHAWKVDERRRGSRVDEPPQERSTLEAIANTQAGGMSLAEHSSSGPVLLVFLRHSGCTFCREALAELAKQRSELEQHGRLVLVHMGPEDEATRAYFERYGASDLLRVSDPDRALYRAFGLGRGSIGQLFGLRVWIRGMLALVTGGHGVGKLVGDGFQMPGAFVIEGGRVVRAYIHRDAAERPDYGTLLCPAP